MLSGEAQLYLLLLHTYSVLQVQLGDGGADDGGLGGSLPVIIFIMTKMLTLPGKPPMNVCVMFVYTYVCVCVCVCGCVLLSWYLCR